MCQNGTNYPCASSALVGSPRVLRDFWKLDPPTHVGSVTFGRLGSQLARDEVVLGRRAKRICYPVEEGEHCDYVNSLRNLILVPARPAEFLHVFMRRPAGRLSNQFCIFEQRLLSNRKVCLIELTLGDGFDRFIGCSLNPQEVGVTIDSIWTTVQRGNISGKHLLVTPREVALGEVDSIRELHNLPQEVRPSSKAFDNARNLLPSRSGAPGVVCRSGVAGSLVILDDANLGGGFWIVLAHVSFVETSTPLRPDDLCGECRPSSRRLLGIANLSEYS